MKEKNLQPNNTIKILGLIHIALVFGLVVFLVFSYYQSNGFSNGIDQGDIFIYITPIVAISGYFGSQFMFKKLIAAIRKEDTLQYKLQKYQMASIIKFALIEGPSFLALFAYMISGNTLHFAIAICLIAYLILQRPTLDKFISQVKPSLEDRKQLDPSLK